MVKNKLYAVKNLVQKDKIIKLYTISLGEQFKLV